MPGSYNDQGGGGGGGGGVGGGIVTAQDTWANIGALPIPSAGDNYLLTNATGAPARAGGAAAQVGDVVTYTGSTWLNLGPGAAQGPKGDKGDPGNDAVLDDTLGAIAATTETGLIERLSNGLVSLLAVTAFGRSLIAAANAAVGRTLLELGDMATRDANNLPAINVATALAVNTFSDTPIIDPALFLRKDSTAGFNGMGLAKIQWRGTTSAGDQNVDGGRIDSVITNAEPDQFTAVMGIHPAWQGNPENIAAATFGGGVQIGSEDSIHACTDFSGGSGYAVNDIVRIDTATGLLGQGRVTVVSGGAPTQILISNAGYNYQANQTAQLVAITGSGSGATCVVRLGLGIFFQGFGTLSLSRGLFMGDTPVVLLENNPDNGYFVSTRRLQVFGSNPLFNYGPGTLNISNSLIINNRSMLSANSTGLVGRSRAIPKRFTTLTGSGTSVVSELFNLVDVNASGNLDVTLYSANLFGTGQSGEIWVRRVDAGPHTVRLLPPTGQTIDGATSLSLAPGQRVLLYGVNTSWGVFYNSI
ncbi:MAG: hypothetical protein HC890_12580 [Chloroflexaceae bacterium]|nr:hypothetical protein [Chloroflexaceae bacterium]